jgi:hypothetical protein
LLKEEDMESDVTFRLWEKTNRSTNYVVNWNGSAIGHRRPRRKQVSCRSFSRPTVIPPTGVTEITIRRMCKIITREVSSIFPLRSMEAPATKSTLYSMSYF